MLSTSHFIPIIRGAAAFTSEEGSFTATTPSTMSQSNAVSDEKKPGNAAATCSNAGSVTSFSIDGLLGLKQRETADKKDNVEEKGEHAEIKPSAVSVSSQSPGPVAATHLIYSAAAASTMVHSASALHGALWSSHPAAAIAAFRRKWQLCSICVVFVVINGVLTTKLL